MMLCIVVPVFTFIMIRRLVQNLKFHDRKHRFWYGELYESFLYLGLSANRLDRLLYNFFYMVRRSLTIVSIFYMEKVVGFQIGVIMMMSILFAGNNIANRPYNDQQMNKIDAFNEVMYYILLAFSFAFTNNNSDEDSKITIGTVWNTVLIVMMSVNVLLLLIKTVRTLYKHFVRCVRHRKLRKQRKLQLEKKLKI